MNRIYTTLITLIIASSFASAQEATPKALSLQDCWDYAMEHNYTVKNSQLDILIQEAQNAQTASLALPSVTGKADFTYFAKPQSQFLNARTFGGPTAPDVIVGFAFAVPYTASAGLSASQIIFDGSALVALQARKMAMELATQNTRTTRDNTRYNIYNAYFTLAVAYRQREILVRSLAIVRSMANELEKMNQGGFVEKIDVDRSGVQLNNLQNDSASLENGIRTMEYSLKFAMGMDIKAPIVLTDTAIEGHTLTASSLLSETYSYDKLPEFAVLNSYKTLMDFNVKRYRLSALPSLVAFGSLGTNYGSDKFKDIMKFDRYAGNSLIGLQLNMPIFAGFKRINQVKEAKLSVEKAENNISNLKAGIDFAAIQAKAALTNSLNQFKSQTTNLALANEVIDLAQKKYKAGVGSNLEVTTAQAELLKAQNSYFATLLNIISAEASLKKALGQFNLN